MFEDIEEVLFTEKQISKRICELADMISRDYSGKELLLIGVLKGSFIFLADLMRQIKIPCMVDFTACSSYADAAVSSGSVKITKDISIDIENKDVLIVEDILDSGRTVNHLLNIYKKRNPASIKLCVMLNKTERREIYAEADYIGFDIPEGFIVGYGLDYAQRYRGLPYIGILKKSVYEDC